MVHKYSTIKVKQVKNVLRIPTKMRLIIFYHQAKKTSEPMTKVHYCSMFTTMSKLVSINQIICYFGLYYIGSVNFRMLIIDRTSFNAYA